MELNTKNTTLEAIQIFVDFLAKHPDDEEILNFTFPKSIQNRIQKLVLKNNKGTINSEELNELKEYERLDMYSRLLKTKIALYEN